jgi:phosphoserine aminotransferase
MTKLMTTRDYNFNAGPAALPLEVLEEVQADMVNYKDSGKSIIESSHRGKEYEEVHFNTMKNLEELLGCKDSHSIILMNGGARMQFALAPMNLAKNGQSVDFLVTGTWAKGAAEEAGKVPGIKSNVLWSGVEDNFNHLPKAGDYKVNPKSAYLHYASNNTIFGTQYHDHPESGNLPLVADMSSDILCREMDISKHALVYAGSQKNLGPAGLSVVAIRNDYLDSCPDDLPVAFSYKAIQAKDSLLYTPNCFAIYVVGLVTDHLIKNGGIKAIEKMNRKKADLLYDLIDNSDGFYTGTCSKDSRSLMNVTINMETEELEKQFVAESTKAGFTGLKGHRSVGGIRASIYNSVPLENVEALAEFMKDFKAKS